MRIIAGQKKGFQLESVPGKATRPTSDKVKESVFNIIGPFFDGGSALDLFAGTGNLGIEALSRGIDHVIFVDINRQATEVVRKNLSNAGFTGQAEVYTNDACRALKAIVKRELSFDIIFLDPPYAKQQLEKQLHFIEENQLLKGDGVIVIEHDASIDLPTEIATLKKEKTISYRSTSISLYSMDK